MRPWAADKLIPVVAHPLERESGAGSPIAGSRIGLRWGKAARASYEREAPRADPASGGGFNTITPPEYKRVKKVHELTPVYAEFDVVEVRSVEDPEETIEVSLTRAVIFKLGEVTEKRIVGATFVGGALTQTHFEDVKIVRYLRLEFQPQRPPRSTWRYSDTWGEYPPEPEEFAIG